MSGTVIMRGMLGLLALCAGAACESDFSSRQVYSAEGREGLGAWCFGDVPQEILIDRRLDYEIGKERFDESREGLLTSCWSLEYLFEAESTDRVMIQSLESQTTIFRGQVRTFMDRADNLFDPIPLPVEPFRNECTQDLETVSLPDGVTSDLRAALREEQRDVVENCRVLDTAGFSAFIIRMLLGYPSGVDPNEEPGE